MPKIKNTVKVNEPNLTTDSPFSELNTAKAELEELAKQFLKAFNLLNDVLNDNDYDLNERKKIISSALNNLAKDVNNKVDNTILGAIKIASVKSNEKINELKAQEDKLKAQRKTYDISFGNKDNSTESETNIQTPPVQSEIDEFETEFKDFIES